MKNIKIIEISDVQTNPKWSNNKEPIIGETAVASVYEKV